jgi:hypothetical protein
MRNARLTHIFPAFSHAFCERKITGANMFTPPPRQLISARFLFSRLAIIYSVLREDYFSA